MKWVQHHLWVLWSRWSFLKPNLSPLFWRQFFSSTFIFQNTLLLSKCSKNSHCFWPDMKTWDRSQNLCLRDFQLFCGTQPSVVTWWVIHANAFSTFSSTSLGCKSGLAVCISIAMLRLQVLDTSAQGQSLNDVQWLPTFTLHLFVHSFLPFFLLQFYKPTWALYSAKHVTPSLCMLTRSAHIFLLS